jgi:uncharacterized membrane protein
MASLSSAKILGGVGAILALIPGISVVGWILILISQKEISDATQDKAIFQNALIGVITAVISAIALVVFLVSGPFIGFLDASAGLPYSFGPGGLAGALAIFGLFDGSAIVSGIFLKRSYDRTTQGLKVGAFATSGLLYLVGALTAMVVAGFLIFFIAFIYQIIAYFSIQDRPQTIPYDFQPPPQPMPIPAPQVVQPPLQPLPTPTPQTVQPQAAPIPPLNPAFKFCYNCGTKLPFSAHFCWHCGTKQS